MKAEPMTDEGLIAEAQVAVNEAAEIAESDMPPRVWMALTSLMDVSRRLAEALTRPLTEEEVERAARALTEAEITEWWGERCDAFEAACCVCQAWARHDIIAAMAEEDEHTRLESERDRKERAALAAVGR